MDESWISELMEFIKELNEFPKEPLSLRGGDRAVLTGE
jgi:hypothetical protein